MNDKFPPDVCEKEFQRMCVAHRIDTDVTAMVKSDQRFFEAHKKAILKVMGRGQLIISADGNPELSVSGSDKKLVFGQVTGAILMAQDGFGPYDDIARGLSVSTALTGSTSGALSKLHRADLGVVSELTNFLIHHW